MVALRAQAVDLGKLKAIAKGGGPPSEPDRRAIATFGRMVIPDGTPFILKTPEALLFSPCFLSERRPRAFLNRNQQVGTGGIRCRLAVCRLNNTNRGTTALAPSAPKPFRSLVTPLNATAW